MQRKITLQHILTESEYNYLLHSNEELKQLKHYQKTGRTLIIDKETKQIIKVINK